MEGETDTQHDSVTQPLLSGPRETDASEPLPSWATPRAKWKLVKVENGLRIFLDASPERKKGRGCFCCLRAGSCSLKAVGVVAAAPDTVFDLVTGLASERGQWDPLFDKGRVVEKIDGSTDVVQKCFRAVGTNVKAQDFCLLRSNVRPPGGSIVVSYQSTQHKKCPVQAGYARGQLKSGGYIITALQGGPQPQTLLEHVVELDEGGWLCGPPAEAVEALQLQLLYRIAGAREYFAAHFPTSANPQSIESSGQRTRLAPLVIRRVDSARAIGSGTLDSQASDADAEFFDAKEGALSESASEAGSPPASLVDTATSPSIPPFSGSVRRASNVADGRDCWSVPDPAGFSLRSRSYPFDGGMERAKEPFFTLVAVDWFKSDVRMDRLARRPGGLVNRTLKGGPPFVFVVNMQVPAGPVHYSMVYYFASYQPITDRMLFHAFMHGDDAYRDARLTLLPNIPNGSWLIRQSVGSRPVPLAQVLKCRYDKGEHFFEIDVDMGTSAIVRYVLSLVLPVVTILVVDMAFLIRGDTEEELPEVLLGAVRLHTLELTSAIPPPPEA
ncbi:hypothetical protein KFL_002990020 [Klebsormidium nitens]|uniref:START domain-containing protein n=1 Tax=Klebsormidium nitens TaxID=105231 RepID=A0A1Y1I6K4_KLENI|nr:hypothetical protein KFL_002990020 [Klebsormidium nitens]|eukprot:GAQ86594.1 hypothetical protein KFL_002990020 [Klebsormidium nitens]